MKLTQMAAKETMNGPPLKRLIWKSIRHKDFSMSVRYFLWMIIHDGYKVGHYWDNIPTTEAAEVHARYADM